MNLRHQPEHKRLYHEYLKACRHASKLRLRWGTLQAQAVYRDGLRTSPEAQQADRGYRAASDIAEQAYQRWQASLQEPS